MLKHVLRPLILTMLIALAGCAGFGGSSVQDESGQAFDPSNSVDVCLSKLEDGKR